MNRATTSRRAILATAAALIPAAAFAAAPAPIVTGLSPELQSLLDAASRLEAHGRAFDRGYDAIRARYDAALQAEVAAIPHTVIDAGPSITGGRVLWSTDSVTSRAVTATLAATDPADPLDGAHVARAREFVAALDRREQAVKDARARVGRETGLTAYNAQSQRLTDAQTDAYQAVTDFPVRTAADLAAKVDRILAWGWGMEECADTLRADTRRLAGLEG